MALNIFKSNKKNEADKKEKTQEIQTQWIKCNLCNATMYYKEIILQNSVCPKCNYHFKINANDRIKLIFDEGSIKELDKKLSPIDPLNFVDKKSYKQRIEEYASKSGGRESSAISIEAKVNKIPVQAVIFDFEFMGGSLASVEGEKIVRAINRAINKKQGLIICSASGGARMQESTFSLMQMAKTSAALEKLSSASLPYISILTDPTLGGVSASFAFLGDIIIAEPGATIGFAGARVIKQTIGENLPKGFQTAEFLLEHGLVDMVVHRKDLKKTISDLLGMLLSENKNLSDNKKNN
ncbi:acetyl-CoA carboxylase, carboxyltransferase subunit beta [Helicobacter sp. MIT 14-3879]|uniref:acetyl-CoA carboxylase, carboxyltransferase subunit beta n=1 Tax=Helicobacter sp. MIT 14-3879 TaxID=2040649 RepID=UPI000E1F43DA|nr:acetyl-CoA carboxylase, carboxyltransferase subunit beta [Helicobacter sp. MIT 14-3879]RDU64087.1 acetyl-CoA carboxylase carboxyl transferase subunit beta [Helicobacter sp. MIT 14-3879]